MFLVHNAFVRTNRHTIAIMFVCPSVCPSMCLGQMCIVIIRCTLMQILAHGWIVQCSGHPDTIACPLTPSHLFPVPPGREVGYGHAN